MLFCSNRRDGLYQVNIPAWMDLVHLVIDGFPYLIEDEYLGQLKRRIQKKQALIIKDVATIIGVYPQYRKRDIAKAFLQKLWGKHKPTAFAVNGPMK